MSRIELRVGDRVKVYDAQLPTGEAFAQVLEHLPEMPDWKVHIEFEDYEGTWGVHWKQVELSPY